MAPMAKTEALLLTGSLLAGEADCWFMSGLRIVVVVAGALPAELVPPFFSN